MPHACGRVGRGLYLASEHSKSAAYVSCGRRGRDLIGVRTQNAVLHGLVNQQHRHCVSFLCCCSGEGLHVCRSCSQTLSEIVGCSCNYTDAMVMCVGARDMQGFCEALHMLPGVCMLQQVA